MRQPIKFLPYFKSTAWGGRRISVFKNLSVNCSDIGESWELSAISGCESIVANGDDSGMTLPDLCIKYRERLLGENVYQRFGTEFPLLVKFIDAKTDTSMQVNISMQGDRDKETIGYAYYPEGDAAAHEGEESGTTALAQCEYFKVNKEDIEGSRTLSNAEDSFMGIVCIDGDGKLKVDGVSTSVRQGEALLLPAHVDEFDVEGVLSLLTVVIPTMG